MSDRQAGVIKRITWEGNLSVDPQLNGLIGKTVVATITVVDGQIALKFVSGVNPGRSPVRSIKRAKELAEETLLIFLHAINARFLLPDELVILEAMRDGFAKDDPRHLLRLYELWKKRFADASAEIDWIGENLDDLHKAVEHWKAHADAQA